MLLPLRGCSVDMRSVMAKSKKLNGIKHVIFVMRMTLIPKVQSAPYTALVIHPRMCSTYVYLSHINHTVIRFRQCMDNICEHEKMTNFTSLQLSQAIVAEQI